MRDRGEAADFDTMVADLQRQIIEQERAATILLELLEEAEREA